MTALQDDDVRTVIRDDQPTVLVTCPLCGVEQEVDQDQVEGRVSMKCATDGCSFHETQDLRPLLEGVEWR